MSKQGIHRVQIHWYWASLMWSGNRPKYKVSRFFLQECLNRKENNKSYLKRMKFIKKAKT